MRNQKKIIILIGIVLVIFSLLIIVKRTKDEECIVSIDYPIDTELIIVDNNEKMFDNNSSGLDIFKSKLYCISNSGIFWVMDLSEDPRFISYSDGFDSNGKKIMIKDDNGNTYIPDTEGITVDKNGTIYAVSERLSPDINLNTIVQFDAWTNNDTVIVERIWNLNPYLPKVKVNNGLEGIEWVSFDDVDGKLYDENKGQIFNHNDYENAMSEGVFFVALEENGHIYAFVLNDNNTVELVSDIDSKLCHAMSLDYDTNNNVLWAKADNNCKNKHSNIQFNGTSTPNITVISAPSEMNEEGNYEGFAISDVSYTKEGKRPVYHFLDGKETRTLVLCYITSEYD